MSRLQHYLSTVPQAERSSAAIAYLASLDHVATENPKIVQGIEQELRDQRTYLKLIASENYCSLAAQLAMGNLLTDKYSEGYVNHRFYAGCDNVDLIEEEANVQLKKLFGCDHVYVQPHSGADANMVAFWAMLVYRVQDREMERLGHKKIDELNPAEYEQVRQRMVNQKLLGMSLNSGGHLSHGYRHHMSSKMMQSFLYEVDRKTGLLDYSEIARQAKEVKPDILLAGYSAYPRRVNMAKMREIADSVGALFMVDMAHFAGLVAGKVFTGEEDPIPYAHIVTSTTHKTLRGPRGGIVLCKQELAETINKGCPLVLGGPLPHVMAAKAVAFREANTSSYRDYAQGIVANARALADGLVRRGARLVTGGTDNHLIIIDVSPYGLSGRQAEMALREAHMTVNRNAIPYDPNGPWYTSGVRIGTPALTTLGMGVAEMDRVAEAMVTVLKGSSPEAGSKAKYTLSTTARSQARGVVRELLDQHPLYPEIPLGIEHAVI